MICGKCGKEIPDSAKFCRFCGGKTEPMPASKQFCMECGKILDTGAKFCRYCGTKVPSPQEAQIPSAGSRSSGVVIPTDGPVEKIVVSDEMPVPQTGTEAKRPIRTPQSEPVRKSEFGEKAVASGKAAATKAVSSLLKRMESEASASAGEVSYHVSGGKDKALNKAIHTAFRTLKGK